MYQCQIPSDETISDRRTEEDYVAFLKELFAGDERQTGWEVVADNVNTHRSEVRLIADLCSITDDLGVKGKSGILKNTESREKFCAMRATASHFILRPTMPPG